MGDGEVPGRSPRAQRLRLLGRRPILRGLDESVLEEVDAALVPRRVPGGSLVVRSGEMGVAMMLIVEGGLRASFVDAEGRRNVVFEYFAGGTVGEALMLSGRPSPLDLHAIRDTELLCLPPDRFERLAERHPAAALRLARLVTGRLVDLGGSPDLLTSFSRRTDRAPRTIAVVVAGGEAVRRLGDLVSEALSRSRSTIRLRKPGDLGKDATTAVADAWMDLSSWRAGLDGSAELAVLECGRADAAWLDFCLRQADRILVLLDPREGLPSATDWWRGKFEERTAPIDLALVHDPSAAPPGTAAAYAALPGVVHLHHVRAFEARDGARLSRWLLDRPVGLVLGGGGARGIAHVGIFKALEQAGVPVDVVGGTSMGAIFAGAIALGWSADRMMAEVKELFGSRFALYDPTFPRTSLLAGKKLDRVLKALFADVDIVDLWLPFFCVATNLSRASAEVRDAGRVRDAIRSSCSIPGLFPPFRAVDQLLVDGGLVDNLPIDVMRARCHGPVIAADVSGLHQLGESGPRLLEILACTTSLSSQRATDLALASHPPALHLVPELGKFRMLDWRAYEAIFEAGYQCATHALETGALPATLWEGRLDAAD